MAASSEFDILDKEVKELLENYKHKKATTYEPCTIDNYLDCLIGLREELGILNINYIFNPHLDMEDGKMYPEAIVNLINAIWTLLLFHKNSLEKSERLMQENHYLEQNNKQLNKMVSRLNDKVRTEMNESRACVASAQRVSDNSDKVVANLTEARARILQLTKQKDAIQKGLEVKISRLRLENEKYQDMLRNKSGTFTPCTVECNATILRLKECDKKHRSVIAQLQSTNQELLREVLTLKEDVILSGLSDFQLD